MEREFVGVSQAFGASGCMFGSRITVSVGTSSTVYLPAGAWLCECDANSTVKFSYDSGTTWVTWIAASTVGAVCSDGFLVAFVGGAAPGSPKRTQLLAWQ